METVLADTQLLGRLVELVRPNCPPMEINQLRLPELGAVAVGGLLAFYGCSLAKGAIGLSLACLGALLGWRLGGPLGIEPTITSSVAAVLAGLVGLLLYRILAAGLSGVLTMAAVAVVLFIQVGLPEAGGFDSWLSGVETGTELRLPSASEQQVGAAGDTWSRLVQYSAYWREKQPQDRLYWILGIGAAGVSGVLIGLLWPNLAMTVWLTTVGVLAAAGGLLALVAMGWPDLLDRLVGQQQSAVVVAVAVVWGLAMLMHMQRAVTRRIPVKESKTESAVD